MPGLEIVIGARDSNRWAGLEIVIGVPGLEIVIGCARARDSNSRIVLGCARAREIVIGGPGLVIVGQG